MCVAKKNLLIYLIMRFLTLKFQGYLKLTKVEESRTKDKEDAEAALNDQDNCPTR